MPVEAIVTLPDQHPVLRLRPQPNDANASGDIFGGWLMSNIDIAGVTAAIARSQGYAVTVAVKELTFLLPIYVYDLVSFYATVLAVGRTSMTIKVEVYAQRVEQHYLNNQAVKVSESTLVYVAVRKPGEPREVPKE